MLLVCFGLLISLVCGDHIDQDSKEFGWSSWSKWSHCNKACLQTRQRSCTLFPDTYYGCGLGVVDTLDIRECVNTKPSSWGPWTGHSSCSESCGRGQQTIYRECDMVCERPCKGKRIKVTSCDTIKCCQGKYTGLWGEWGHFGPCKPKRGHCGKGKRVRVRKCVPDNNCPKSVPFKCKEGKNKEKIKCKVPCN